MGRSSSAGLTRPIDIVEAAYDVRGGVEAWLRRLLRAVATDLDMGEGVYADVGRFEEDELVAVVPVVGRRTDPQVLAAIRSVPVPHEVVAHLRVRAVEIGTLSEAFGPRGPTMRSASALIDHFGDSIGAFAQDGETQTVRIHALSRSKVRIHPRSKAAWRRVLFHVGTALRLRTRIQREAPTALLAPSARIVHAEGDARTTDARAALAEAVRRIERARGARVRNDPDAALALWNGLVEGRWSLVDHHEADGKRYLAAHENVPTLPDPRALGRWENACLRYYLRGASTSEIAFAFGRQPATVGRTLSKVARQLGFPNRAALRVVSEERAMDRLALDIGGTPIDVLVLDGLTIDPSWNDVLGPAARDVAARAARGMSDDEIAAARGVSRRTISNQLAGVYRALDVSGRSDLARRLSRRR